MASINEIATIPVVDADTMADQPLQLHIEVRARGTPAGTYTYRIIDPDNPTSFVEEGGSDYRTDAAAAQAGEIALRRLLSLQQIKRGQ